VVFALLCRFLANDKYIVGKSSEGWTFMADVEKCTSGLRAPIPYSANSMDRDNRNVGPFSKQNISSLYYRHWLGTDHLGRDVFAGLIYGCFVAFKVGVLTSLFSLFLGIVLGYLSGYYGDEEMRINKNFLLPYILFAALFIFYGIYTSGILKLVFFLAPIFILWIMIAYSRRDYKTTFGVPFDLIIFRFIEIINSIPGLFLILILLALFTKPALINVIIVISLLRWPVITRHLRAEILKIKEEDFVTSARVIGQKNWKIFLYHILPLAISPVIIVVAFGFSASILMESTLSFLGIGVPMDQITWGSLIRQARTNFSSWWLAFFPGLAIYIIIVLFNSIGESINKRLRREY
jgi:peptide/nickel transport system permease protein